MSRTQGEELVGRQAEMALLSRTVDAVLTGSGGSSVMLRGEAGIGKTALLTWVRLQARERGFDVLGAVGAMAEAELAFGALHQIVWPLLERSSTLPHRQRHALECALGLGAGTPPAGVMLGEAALALLAEMARTRPLLVTVDDLHWVDTSSAAVFEFLHRRIGELPVMMVGAGRDDRAPAGGWASRVVPVEALEPEAATSLLRRRHPGLSAADTARVLEEARGNPLALLELPARRVSDPSDGLAPAPAHTPLSGRLERLFTDRITSLSREAARVMLLTALGGVHGAGSWHRAVPDSEAEAVISELEGSGLAHLAADGTLSFRHPLVRSAVISMASPREQRHAHKTLATSLAPDDPRRVVHESLAAVLPDASLARRLEEAARRLSLRGGDAEGAVLMDRAAALSTEADSHTGRLVWAAVMAARGGRLAHTAKLVNQLRQRPVPADFAPLFAYAVVYVDQSHHIDFESSFLLLPEALDALTRAPEERFGELAEQIYFKLLLAATYTDDPRAWRALSRHADHVSPLARLCHRAWSDPARTAHGVRLELDAMTAGMDAEQEAGAAWLLLWTASAVDAADETLWRRFTGQHAYATQGSVAKARYYQDYLRGRWENARNCLQEAKAAEDLGYHCNALLFRHYYAHFLAGRGDEEGLRDLEALIRPRAERARMCFVTDHLTHLRGLVALAHGRVADAYDLLVQLTPAGDLRRGLPWFHLPFFDFVEAAVRTGRMNEARAHIAAGRSACMPEISPHHAFLLAAATALGADDSEADACYRAAYAVEGAEDWVFTMARLRLAHGSWLRRRRRTEAEGVLRLAHEAFQRLGAEPWSRRCEEELAARESEPLASRAGRGTLTGQERRIAELAGKGLTNKEIGTLLQLSPRTVASHLYSIFPKLGITSRAGLAEALNES
ncbi:BREX system ATP-binding domain-containing protein [Streptomyces sp. BK79]|uniref:helix-turn-helix transcriptional regulator n=1 Tax=Streptomyces sp. BK79 TaxID=3350097 RepID=UPI00377048AA